MLHTVGIVGLGLIGGSFAKALRGRVGKLVGVDPRVQAPGLIDSNGPLGECDLVIVATPMEAIPKLLPRIAREMNPDAVLMDVASVKAPVFDAFLRLKKPVNFVSGHPMAGTEHTGFEHASADLFRGRPFLLIPGAISSKRPIQIAEALVKIVGAKPVWMATPEEHDYALAAISHLPHVLAFTLLDCTQGLGHLGGPSFQGCTRVAHSDPEAVAAYLIENRGNLLKALRDFERSLDGLEHLIARGDKKALAAALRRIKR